MVADIKCPTGMIGYDASSIHFGRIHQMVDEILHCEFYLYSTLAGFPHIVWDVSNAVNDDFPMWRIIRNNSTGVAIKIQLMYCFRNASITLISLTISLSVALLPRTLTPHYRSMNFTLNVSRTVCTVFLKYNSILFSRCTFKSV